MTENHGPQQEGERYFAITVDTEEDEWSRYARSGHDTENITRLGRLQRLCESYGAVPTYLVTYPVASHTGAVATLKGFANSGAEIGAHCHPWNTPPFSEELTEANTMLCNLDPTQVANKLEALLGKLAGTFGSDVRSFRAGRWGFGSHVARSLATLGVRVDSSITPLVDWSPYRGPNHLTAPTGPYRFSPERPLVPDSNGVMLELPPTIGFLQRRQGWAGSVFRLVASGALGHLPLSGALDVAGLLNRRWLSPEVSSGDEIDALCEVLMADGTVFLNYTLHSNSLLPGATPFADDDSAVNELLDRTKRFLRICTRHRAKPVTLSEAGDLLFH